MLARFGNKTQPLRSLKVCLFEKVEMKKIVSLFATFLLSGQICIAQNNDIQLIITTPGYTSIYRYGVDDFAEGVRKDFRVQASVEPVAIQGSEGVEVVIEEKTYRFAVSGDCNVVRLIYDRNRRFFSGAGFNYVENDTIRYEAPNFKGTALQNLSQAWQKDLNKMFTDKSFLDPNEPNVFLLEAEIDEKGMIHRIVELSGGLRQYSKIIIDKMYDIAMRGWEPARRNGEPYRTLAQIRFEIESREADR